jgi:Zn-dependent M16 (insulinase) family peptidase
MTNYFIHYIKYIIFYFYCGLIDFAFDNVVAAAEIVEILQHMNNKTIPHDNIGDIVQINAKQILYKQIEDKLQHGPVISYD